ncbi:SMP-30/gluconolactonase/LRE family protein [Sphingomonas sp. SUN039]|uniref:SMP-30/gluconolactonase/LRE family protein n=1 Tax=Sphingomonas sp. SUN039 TaxID=2937787 RepID=UPI002164C4FA|nr:SMP-30/gluconolactonase/LRE family protein [Sphingomonas sp. SUN039]UVO55741.1 SMP-30/gluconolactonase/LRE family protein [Sphingomonas sp. SUN039]
MSIDVRLVWPVEALLGEGPVWVPDEAALRFVDIKRGQLHRYMPRSGTRETFDLGGQPSFVVLAHDGTLVVGAGNRILSVGSDGVTRAVVTEIQMPAHNRTNDATVDGQGRLWFGTMDDEERRPTGALWCLDQGSLHRIGGEAVVTNGPAITRDGRTLYHVDSGNRRIWRYAIGEGPSIGDPEIFLQLTPHDGYPDGVVLDSEDCLWVALWDGWGVRRYAPDGELLLTVALPCARVTKIAFGGADLRTAYVTTARVGLDAAALAAQPLAGGLFAFDAPVAGNALPAAVLPV